MTRPMIFPDKLRDNISSLLCEMYAQVLNVDNIHIIKILDTYLQYLDMFVKYLDNPVILNIYTDCFIESFICDCNICDYINDIDEKKTRIKNLESDILHDIFIHTG